MKRTILTFWLITFFLFAYTQTPFKSVHARMVDYVTNVALDDSLTLVELLRADSVIIDTAMVFTRVDRMRKTTLLDARITEEGDYILRCSHPNYHTLYFPFHAKFYKREAYIELGKIAMKRKSTQQERELGEATVEATKLKFYFNKDTLVYNASAFITQEGFVLQNILQKMPGLTINKDGEIYSNGRKVETLMLNGKDFFNSDRKTLLENLPAFMVKNIKIYAKEKDSLALFERERELEGLVMDVRLKPEYHSVLIGNMDLAGGTDKHYYGRFLMMKIHDFHRWSVYVGANDVNKNEELTHNDQFRNMDNGTGEKDFYNAGFNYNVDEKEGKYSLEGKTRLQISREWVDQRQVSQSFYTTGDIYSLNRMTNLAKNLSVQTDHSFTLFNESPWRLSIKPSFVYIRSRNRAGQDYGTFDRNVVDSLGTAWTDSLQNPELGRILQLYGINRMSVRSKTPTTLTQGQLELEKTIEIPHTEDRLTLGGSAFYVHNDRELFSQRSIDYIRQTSSTWQNDYQHAWSNQWKWTAKADYLYRINEFNSLTANLRYERENSHNSDSYYNLHGLPGWENNDGNHSLGMLPSESDMLKVMDPSNSKSYKEYADNYQAGLAYRFDKRPYNLSVSLPLNIYDRSLDFFQNQAEKQTSKTLIRPDFNLSVGKWMTKQTGLNFYFSYSLENKLPQMIYLIDQTNDANPLYIVKGNPHLKSSISHRFGGNFYWAPNMKNNHNLSFSYTYINGLTAMSTLFDRNTGVYTYTPRSVDGNQVFNITLQDAMFLSPKFTHRMVNKLTFVTQRSIDFSGIDMEEYLKTSTVHNYRIAEELTYGFSSRNTKVRGELAPYITYNRSISDRTNFETLNAFDFGARFNLQIELPKSVLFQTDMRSVSRRGYNDSAMNDDEFIWNASLGKSFKKGWGIKLEAFDLLGQYKNVMRFVNAQGRTEVITNHLRRYAMIHLTWQFNKR